MPLCKGNVNLRKKVENDMVSGMIKNVMCFQCELRNQYSLRHGIHMK